MRQIVRGNSIQWAATFYDFDGAITNPLNAFVDVDYYQTATVQTTISIPMLQNGNIWLAVWDSGQAVAGQNSQVSWHLRSVAAAGIKSAFDGTFTLTANVSNTL